MSKSLSARDRISASFIQLLKKEPFIALVGIKFPIVQDDNQPTMYVNGKVIGFNEQFVLSLTPDELKGVVAHEILHLALLHLYRRGGRHPLLWNYATDLAINWILKQEGHVLPQGTLYSEEFANKPAEEIYDILESRMKKKMAGGGGQGQNPQNGQNQGAGQGAGQSQDRRQDQGSSGQGGSGGNRHGKSAKDRALEDELIKDLISNGAQGTKVIDDHSHWEEGTVDQRESTRRKLEQTLREAQHIARQKQQGTGAGLIDRLVSEILNPKIHWSKYVKRMITPKEEDYCFTSPSIHYSYRGDISPLLEDVPLPGETKRGAKLEGVVFVLDTSGSISDKEAAQYIAEMQGLMNQFPDTYAMYMSCDWECTDPVDLQTVDGSKIDIRSIRLKGGGGTSFKPPFEYFAKPENKRKYDVKLLVYFTDGYGDFPTEKPPYPVIFCVTTERIKDVPEWATAVEL